MNKSLKETTKAIKSHKGVPKVLAKQFADDREHTIIYDTEKCTFRKGSVRDIGVEKGYYDEETERTLSDSFETQLGNFLKSVNGEISTFKRLQLVYENKKLIETFLKFQSMRPIKILDHINEESITSHFFGDLSPSDLIKLATKMNANPLQMLEGERCARIIYANEAEFLENSIGFGLLFLKGKPIIFIPTSPKMGICIGGNDMRSLYGGCSHMYVSEEQVIYINKLMLILERLIGFGFVFGKNKIAIEKTLNLNDV